MRSIAVIPSDAANSAPNVMPAASRCASMMPATPRAAITQAPASMPFANLGTARNAIKHVDATPTIAITPMKNSQRATTARIDGGGDTTDLAA